jgi:hypothetical protein
VNWIRETSTSQKLKGPAFSERMFIKFKSVANSKNEIICCPGQHLSKRSFHKPLFDGSPQ